MALDRAMCRLQDIDQDEARLEDLLESIDDLVALATLEGRLLYVNRAWREKLGYAHHEVSALTSYQVLDPVHEDEIRATNVQLMAGKVVRDIKRTLIAKDGRRIRVQGSMSCRFQGGKPAYVRAIFHDVTEREKIERMKDELIAIANHEMRSPLMAILTSLELLKKDLESVPERSRRILDLALRNSQRLLDLVNDYLDLDKLDSGGAPFDLETLELSPLVERALEINRPLGERAGVALELGAVLGGARVRGDEERLTQVMTNLLSNAVKFSKSGDAVRVEIVRQSGSLRVLVRDAGPGIPDAFKPRIFGKFCQADGKKRGGSGLGLAISKAIVERHAGRIGFESEPGKGTTFYFDLPERAAA